MGQRTPLYDAHRALGARMVEFAGWDMPISFSGPADEHRAVRSCCGLFDVSHMGEIELTGPEAARVCQELTVNDVSRLRIGDAQYTVLCTDEGGVLDDLIVMRLGVDRYLMVVNAANTAADLAWIEGRNAGRADVVDRSASCALLALQGPEAELALRSLTALDLAALRPFTAIEGMVAGVRTLVSRTGYTGEDGFELMAAATDAPALWEAVLGTVRRRGGLPVGLAARDTLRLEAGLPLCGSDMDTTTTPIEAGLAWVVKLAKGEFVGRERLAAQAAHGPSRRLVGIQMDETAIPRHGYVVWRGETSVGTVTSGTKSPTLGTCIGLAYVASDAAAPGTRLAVEIRGRRLPARVVARPFYRRVRQEG
jgi:glycine cleavage system T protein (aminomethyltransferase)